MTVCQMHDQPSFRRRLNSSTSQTEFQQTRFCSMPKFCNLRLSAITEVWRLVTKLFYGSACTARRARCAGLLYF